jgi:hypothetical protein
VRRAPFYSYIDAGGTVWGRAEYLGDERIAWNINEQAWRSGRAAPRPVMLDAGLDVRGCRTNCRLDKMNRWLWEIPTAPHSFSFCY